MGRVRLRVQDIDNDIDIPFVRSKSATKRFADKLGDAIDLDMIELEDINLGPGDKSQAPVVDRKGLSKKKLKEKEPEKNVDKNPTKITNESDDALCRICWGVEGEDADGQILEEGDINPLISPCKCSGSMGHIHLKCLRGWLGTKRTRKEHKKQIILKFKKLDCELCKVNFPFKITYKNQIVDIVEIERPAKNYIVLESLSNES
jgi:hypothetical protein